MEDSSFAIHPSHKNKGKGASFQDIGNVEMFHIDEIGVTFTCEGGFVTIVFYQNNIVRIIMNPFEKPSLNSSFAVILEAEPIAFTLIEQDDHLLIKSSDLELVIQKAPFRLSIATSDGRSLVKEEERGMSYNHKNEVICFKSMHENDHYYGFGEKTSFLDKRGEKMTMWNSDVYAPHNPEIDALYQSIPFFLTLRDGRAHGIFFDNTFKTVFDMKSSNETYSFWAEGGKLDYYVMAGPTPKEVLKQYTALTGRMPLPPKWAIGYHQSRYSYESEEEVREIATSFIHKGIPIDAIYLDIHYMEGYRVFTFDRERFPNPKELIADLKDTGIHVVPIVDPGVKADPEYKAYQDGVYGDHFCKYIDGKIYHGDVWPGNSAFPDFTITRTRRWWGRMHTFYTDLGIEGIWNDMNEPAVFNETKTMDIKVMHGNDGEPRTHREMHNVYGILMCESTYHGMKDLNKGNRPFLLTRAGYAGVQRYAAVWTGDNRSFWEHLAMALPMCMNLGISGVPFTGPDVGGFAHDTTSELLIRWTQLGAFTPFFRNHNALETISQEPWSFGEETERIIKKYIQLRYIWFPYIYTLFHEASVSGVPVMRPLFMEYPNDKNTFNLADQFLFGEKVIIAPILKPDTYHRVVYLPDGTWFNYWSGEKYEGGQHMMVEADLETLPIFVKEGAIIPHGAVTRSTEFPVDKLTLYIYPMEEGSSTYTLYDDDGKTFAYQNGSYLLKKIICDFNKDFIKINIKDLHAGFRPTWELDIKLFDVKNVPVYLNGQRIEVQFDAKAGMFILEKIK